MGTKVPPNVGDMADPLSPTVRARRAARQAVEATRRRDEAMVEMRAEGATLRQIAEVTGLTHTGVRRILKRLDADDE